MANLAETVEVEKRGRGRPPGTIEDPTSLIKADLGQTLKLQKRLRGVIEDQLVEIEKRLNDIQHPLKLDDRLKAVETLTSAMDTLNKSIQQTAGFIVKVKTESEGKDEMDEERLLSVLMGGKG